MKATVALNLIMMLIQVLHHSETASEIRRKRYVVFPDGSTFSVAFCNTYKMLSPDVDIFTTGLNWAVSYELPNDTIKNPDTNRLTVPFYLRRQRRELYSCLETAMDRAGIDGRACIERSLCETAHKLIPKRNIIEEVLRLIFSFPFAGDDVYDPEYQVYDAAQRRGLSKHDCSELFPTCPVSLVDMILHGSLSFL